MQVLSGTVTLRLVANVTRLPIHCLKLSYSSQIAYCPVVITKSGEACTRHISMISSYPVSTSQYPPACIMTPSANSFRRTQCSSTIPEVRGRATKTCEECRYFRPPLRWVVQAPVPPSLRSNTYMTSTYLVNISIHLQPLHISHRRIVLSVDVE